MWEHSSPRLRESGCVQRFGRQRALGTWLPCALALLAAAPVGHGQTSILGTNLIVNGDAEMGAAGTATALVTSIPGWTRTGDVNVLPYTITDYLVFGDPTPGPPGPGFNYFAAGPKAGTFSLTQDIGVSSAASAISGGNVKYTASAYLGSSKGAGLAPTAQMTVAFKNAGGQTFPTGTVTVGPLGFNGNGISLQQQIGLVPAGTVTITVTLTLIMACENAAQCAYGAADNLSLVLNALGTSPGSVLGTNLVINGNAEAGPGAPHTSTALYAPGWSTAKGASVAPYGGTGWITPSDQGPADRGVNLFCGGDTGANIYQDADVSAAATLIDSGQVTYEISGWIGSLQGAQSPALSYEFFDWSGSQLAATGQLGPPSHSGTGLVELSHTGALPAGTRRIHIALSFPTVDALADDIAFTLAAPGYRPVIAPGGIVSASAFGEFSSIAPGSWIEIYGAKLAASTASWTGAEFNNGVAPTSLADVTSVSIGGTAAFIDYVSSSQINALVPSNAPLGNSPTGIAVTVTNSNGTSDDFWINVNQIQPGLLAPSSFVINGKQYVAALFSDGQTFALPAGAIPGVASRPAKPGDTLTIYGVGFGPVTGGFTAGTIVTGLNTLTMPMQFLFNATPVTPSYYGLAPSFTGLYQFNVTVPSLSTNAALPFSFDLGSEKGNQTLYIAVQD